MKKYIFIALAWLVFTVNLKGVYTENTAESQAVPESIRPKPKFTMQLSKMSKTKCKNDAKKKPTMKHQLKCLRPLSINYMKVNY